MANMNKKNTEIYSQSVSGDDEIDLLELWNTIWSRKKFVSIFTASVVVITIVISLFISNKYLAEVTLLPVSSSSGGGLGDLAGMAALAGLDMGGAKDQTDKIMVLAKSRTVKEQIVREFELDKIIVDDIPKKRDRIQYTIEEFDELFSAEYDKKTKVITLGFKWESPELAAAVVNRYTEVLQNFLEEKALTIEKKNRLFYENQLIAEKKRFRGETKSLAAFQKKSKLLDPEVQAKGTMTLYGALMSQKMSLEMQVQGLESALSPDNPRLLAMKKQLKEINKNLSSIEGSGKETGALPSLGNAPDKMVEYTGLMAGVKVSQAVYETIVKLYEKAKLDEAKAEIYVEVIDPAIVPDKKVSPKRAMMAVVAMFAGLFISVFIVFFMEWMEAAKQRNALRRF